MPEIVEVKKEYTVYSLEEMLADPNLKANLLKANEPEESFVESYIKDEADEIANELESYGFEDVQVHYRISHSQGDGACFDFKNLDLTKWSSYLVKSGADEKQFKLLHEVNVALPLKEYSLSIATSIVNHQYVHECSREVHYYNVMSFKSDCISSIIPFVENMQKTYRNICESIYTRLYKAYMGLYDEKSIIEDLKANGHNRFLENGVIFND